MPLINNEHGNFITIYKGRLTRRVPEGTPGSISRETTKGQIKTVHEKYYDAFVGKLVGIKTMDGGYGKQWLFSFKDTADVYTLALGYDSGTALAFLAMLPNVDLSKEMKVSSSLTINNKGTESTSIFINQNGVPVKHAYTKTNPNGLPAWKPVVVNGVTIWDKTDTLNFLEEMLNRDIIPKLPKEEAQSTSAPKSQLDETFGHEPNAEDQPF